MKKRPSQWIALLGIKLNSVGVGKLSPISGLLLAAHILKKARDLSVAITVATAAFYSPVRATRSKRCFIAGWNAAHRLIFFRQKLLPDKVAV